MNRLRLIFLLMIIVSGCSPRVIPPAEIRDSVRVEIKEYPVYDTLKVEVPKEVVRIETRDTMSFIETSFAKSEACVSNGILYHLIENKPQTWIKPIELKMTEKTVATSHLEKLPPQIIKVEKNLTWWQRTQMIGFRIMIILILVSLAVKYRGSILKLVKMIK